MERSTVIERGIEDWKLKLEFIKDILGETTEGFLKRGLGKHFTPQVLASLTGAHKKWNESTPTSYRYVIKNWCEELFGTSDDATVNFFFRSTLAEFRERCLGKKAMAPSINGPPWFVTVHHTLLAIDEETPKSVRESVRSRRLDQKLYYMNVDSTRVWSDLVTLGHYQMYDWCRDSIKTFVSSPYWINLHADRRFSSIVMLGGGGAASKDVEILTSLADIAEEGEPRPLRYTLVDISSHMLSVSVSRLKRYFRTKQIVSLDVTLKAIVGDIFELREVRDLLRTPDEPCIWFLTGNTFGNISEADFIQSLAPLAEPGDLLVLGIDTFDPSKRAAAEAAIRSNYSPAELKEFLATPISILLHASANDGGGPDTRPRDLGHLISANPVDGRGSGYSDVDDTLTAEVNLVFEEKKDAYVLLTSTRYSMSALSDWCKNRGWLYVAEFPPPDAKAGFRQVVFEMGKEAESAPSAE